MLDKENDVVARVRHNKKKQRFSDAFEEGDHSDGAPKVKRSKKMKAENDPALQAAINDSFDRAMSKIGNDIAPRLLGQPEFCRGSAKTFINERKNYLTPDVWKAGILLVSVLPALTETTPSDESKTAANNLIDRLGSKGAPKTDDFFHALEILVQTNVMVGVGTVITRLYPDRSRSFPETARTTKTWDSASRPSDFREQSIDGDDSDGYGENTMSSGLQTRSSGRSRRQTKKYQEAYPDLISKRKKHTSTSPEAASPVQVPNSKRLSIRFRRNEGSESDALSDYNEMEVKNDRSRGLTKPRPTRVTRSSSGTAPNVTTVFKSSKSANRETSDSPSDQNTAINGQAHFKATPVVPQIQVSEDNSDMARPIYVQNLIDTINEINEGLYDTDSDDNDGEVIFSAVSHHQSLTPIGRTTRSKNRRADHPVQERSWSSDRVLRSARSPKALIPKSLARSSKPSPLKLAISAEQSQHSNISGSNLPTVGDAQSPPRQPASLAVNTIISAEEGQMASAYYAELAQRAGVAQDHPMSIGLSYPELIRPFTDKDGWTSTGVVNEFGEEIIYVDKNRWMIFDPLNASEQHDVGVVAPRRLKSHIQAAEDRVFGFPPRPTEEKPFRLMQNAFRAEDVVYETDLYKARRAAEHRCLPFDRSTTIENLTTMCHEFDLDNIQRPLSTSVEDDVTSVEADGNFTTDSAPDLGLKQGQLTSNGTPVPDSPAPSVTAADPIKAAHIHTQQPPPAVGYSPVRRASDHSGTPADLPRPPVSLTSRNSAPSSHAASVSPSPSKPLGYRPSFQTQHFQSPYAESPTPPSHPPTPSQQQKFTFLQPTDPSIQKTRSPRQAHPAPGALTSPANPETPSLDSPQSNQTASTQQAALNGGFPGGGLIINPRKKDEPPVYKKKIGPDYKMELTNGRLTRPGPNTPQQPTPKRGGQIIDFTGF